MRRGTLIDSHSIHQDILDKSGKKNMKNIDLNYDTEGSMNSPGIPGGQSGILSN